MVVVIVVVNHTFKPSERSNITQESLNQCSFFLLFHFVLFLLLLFGLLQCGTMRVFVNSLSCCGDGDYVEIKLRSRFQTFEKI